MDIRSPETKQLTASPELVQLPHDKQATVQVISATNHDGPTFPTRSRTVQSNTMENLTPYPKTDAAAPDFTNVSDTLDVTSNLLNNERLQALQQM